MINIGGVKADTSNTDYKTLAPNDSDLNCNDAQAEAKMRAAIRDAGQAGDTLGGVFEVVVQNMPIGVGSHIQWDKRLDMQLAGAMMSIQAIKGVEIGDGFGYAENRAASCTMKCSTTKRKMFTVRQTTPAALKAA